MQTGAVKSADTNKVFLRFHLWDRYDPLVWLNGSLVSWNDIEADSTDKLKLLFFMCEI